MLHLNSGKETISTFPNPAKTRKIKNKKNEKKKGKRTGF